jgi:hypothetical protein
MKRSRSASSRRTKAARLQNREVRFLRVQRLSRPARTTDPSPEGQRLPGARALGLLLSALYFRCS